MRTLLLVPPVAWLIAQAAPVENTTSAAVLLTNIGLSGVFLWQWRDEKQQRIKRDDQIIEFAETLGPLAATMTATLDRFEKSVASTMTRAATMSETSLERQILETRDMLAELLAERKK